VAEAGGKKELFGQPYWMWAVGGLVVVGGYLYLRSKSKNTGQSSGGGTGTSAGGGGGQRFGVTFTDLSQWLRDHQKPPARKRKPSHEPRSRRGRNVPPTNQGRG
jgi:hypothetical protein